MPPSRRTPTTSLASIATVLLALTGSTTPADACPFLSGQQQPAATRSSSPGAPPPLAPSSTRRRRLFSSYPSPTEAYASFLPGTLASTVAAIAKTLAPQTVKTTVDRYVTAAAAWNVTGVVEGDDPPASRLEAAASAVEAALAANKAGAHAPDTYDGSVPDGPLAFAEALFQALMYKPVPPAHLRRRAVDGCGTIKKAAAAVRAAGTSGRGPSAGGCNGSVKYELARSDNYGLGVTWPVVNFGWNVSFFFFFFFSILSQSFQPRPAPLSLSLSHTHSLSSPISST